jgi:hypothetical protein
MQAREARHQRARRCVLETVPAFETMQRTWMARRGGRARQWLAAGSHASRAAFDSRSWLGVATEQSSGGTRSREKPGARRAPKNGR